MVVNRKITPTKGASSIGNVGFEVNPSIGDDKDIDSTGSDLNVEDSSKILKKILLNQ